MASNHPQRILADVVDIRNDTPKSDDVFMVDTNVWYFTTYTKASLSFFESTALLSD